jgi:hypothetical protein
MTVRNPILDPSNGLSSSENTEPPVLQHECTIWRQSSQAAFNLYIDGAKLWAKADLFDIEQQLAQSKTHETFRVRLINGTMLATRNPMFGEESPIW